MLPPFRFVSFPNGNGNETETVPPETETKRQKSVETETKRNGTETKRKRNGNGKKFPEFYFSLYYFGLAQIEYVNVTSKLINP